MQLRAENRDATAYNLVGFQNRMRHGEQRRVLRLIPGLQNAEFYRLGRIHRNTYLEAPKVLDRCLRVKTAPRVSLAGQLTGLEGYVECVATGMLAGIFTAESLRGRELPPFPDETAFGAMLRFCTAYEGKDYRPSNVNWGLFPPLADRRRKGRERSALMADRAEAAFQEWRAGAATEESFPAR
ncbi:MAG: hypothetical protein HKN12_05555 [Gemmatimonadetes bacterium]|nr:hypothetical protein [Gemmatimonadota bacterium]